MAKVTISGLIEGGKASGGPPFGPALGPLGVNVNAIIAEINNKTKEFEGIKILAKVHVDPATKSFEVEVGTPSTSAMILKELGAQAGAKTKDETIGNISLDQATKIAKAKDQSLHGQDIAAKVRQVLGTCKSMGVKCEDQDPSQIIGKINSGEIKIKA